MGSEKKRKRVSSGEVDVSSADKAERKRLKKLKKEAELVTEKSTKNSNDPEDTDTGGDLSTKTSSDIPPLLSPIASPMAGRKLTKKLFKLIEAAAKEKSLRRGIKEVVLALRKSDSGIVVLAGDVFPVDVIAHLPLVCEEANVPYCFVPSKLELGHAGMTKRPTSVVLISKIKCKSDEVKKSLKQMSEEVKGIQNLY